MAKKSLTGKRYFEWLGQLHERYGFSGPIFYGVRTVSLNTDSKPIARHTVAENWQGVQTVGSSPVDEWERYARGALSKT